MLQYPLVYELLVCSRQSHSEQHDPGDETRATVAVFTETEEEGKARVQRFLDATNWDIIRFVRVMFICPEQINHLDPVLKKTFKQAELYGIGASFNGVLYQG
jgi:hypothetical protein